MRLEKEQFTASVAGKEVVLEISRLAEQANAAVLGKCGETVVLVTSTMGKRDVPLNYMPLTVDYEEKFYAAGKIIGSRFVRREGRPSDEAVLSGRLIDRALRPLFDHRIRREIQIVVTVLSYDEENDPDFIALLSASTALAISDIPWGGPVSGVTVARTKDGKLAVNPGSSFLSASQDALSYKAFFAGNDSLINMIELGGDDADEGGVLDGARAAQEEIQKLVTLQKEIVKKIGKQKQKVLLAEPDAETLQAARALLSGRLENAVYVKDKMERNENVDELKEEMKALIAKKNPDGLKHADKIFEDETDALVHKNALEKNLRPDGRAFDEVRPLSGETGIFSRLHGSALFIRGNTQCLAVTTLAPPGAEQLVETMETSGKRRFMLHYNFPPYSTGETGRVGGPGRREIGHGALAEKALRATLPSFESFPYTIRLVSEVLSSNGSSSMASACAGSMALMDAGVPMKKPVAGIAMGLMYKDDSHYKILTDIQGPEDHYGDMDCKIAGTKDGITAVQMDTKVDGISLNILGEVLAQAKIARAQILDFMQGVIAGPRENISPHAPTVMSLVIRPDQIGEVVGPGGKVINGIISSTGAHSIDIEQTGKVYVSASTKEQATAAINHITSLLRGAVPGDILDGTVIKILDFGAIVDLGFGRTGMIHVSELKNRYVERVSDVVKIGDKVRVKVLSAENGKTSLSIKALES